ncbi:hypothetical protein CesoFtcFv8_005309 [Champsocephalus esox]|uniref:Uncharacterized protein n=1 Tax=Champsocephalus esox TaxID=159716 RepID=A0AAN8H989_9TELE|nr:hypothetical protein CesoFtcFv8_005309 [Champsocephalus esox]
MGTQRPNNSSSSSTSPSQINPVSAEQQCPLLPIADTCIQQSDGAPSGGEGGKKPLDAEGKSWHNTFRPSQLFEGRSIANHYPIVVPHPTSTGEAGGGGWFN